MRPSEILNFTEISLFQIKFKRFSEIIVMRPSEFLIFTEISLFQIKFKRFSEIIVMRPHKWDADLWDLKSSHVFLNELRTFMVVYLNIKIF